MEEAKFLKRMERFGRLEGLIIGANFGFFGFFNIDRFHWNWMNELISPYEFLTPVLIIAVLFAVFYLTSDFFIKTSFNQYDSPTINDTFSFTLQMARYFQLSLGSLALAFNLLFVYEFLDISLNLESLVDQFKIITLVGLPLVIYIYIMQKIEDKVAEETYNFAVEEYEKNVIEVKAVSRKLDENITEGANTGELVLANGDNDELKQFLISALKDPEFSQERYHQYYAAFVIAEGETTVFNKEELEDMFEFQDELGIDLNSIDIGTLKLLNRTDTEYCTSVIFEYDYDLKIIGNMGLKGKIVNHSIMLWTENGWLFLADTQEI